MSHQIDQGMFRGVLPEDIDWKPFPAFPLSARLAVVVGGPTETWPWVIRVKLPDGVKLHTDTLEADEHQQHDSSRMASQKRVTPNS